MDRIRTRRVASVLRRSCVAAGAASGLLAFSSAPAAADFCLQLNGGDFSGAIGFFRFSGPVPPGGPNTMVPMAGRASGTGEPVFGGAVINEDGVSFQLGATFFIDDEQGQFTASLNAETKKGSGRGRYGEYGTGSSFNAKIVNCNKEPV